MGLALENASFFSSAKLFADVRQRKENTLTHADKIRTFHIGN